MAHSEPCRNRNHASSTQFRALAMGVPGCLGLAGKLGPPESLRPQGFRTLSGAMLRLRMPDKDLLN